MHNKYLSSYECFGMIIILLVTLFTGYFSYINEPTGDDILCYFEGAMTYYLDDYPIDIEKRIIRLDQVINTLQFIYTHWSGRMTGYSVEVLGKLLPKYIQAIITAIILSANVFLAVRIVYGSCKATLKEPAAFIVFFLALYWYRAECYFEYMWIMVSIYSVAVLLVLLYYNLYSYSMNKTQARNIIVMQIIGFLAGFSHEVISLCLIIAIIVGWMQTFRDNNQKWKSIAQHAGLVIGYLLCVLAPGNFYRMLQSHDVVNNSYLVRLYSCFIGHIKILFGFGSGAWMLIFVLLFFTRLVYLRNKEYIKEVLISRMDIIIAMLFSILIWAAFPHQPTYGKDLWIITVYIILLSISRKISECVNVSLFKSGTVALMIIALFIGLNVKEVQSYTKTSFERRALVSAAVERHESEVVVPRFDDKLSNDRYLISSLNGQKEYDEDYYRAYYGIRVVIDKQEK